MEKFRRKLGIGNHNAIISGKRQNIRPGDVVECSPAELGSLIEEYEEIAEPRIEKHRNLPGFVVIADGIKHPATGCLKKEEAEALAQELAAGTEQTPLERETARLEAILREKNEWLSGPQKSGNTLVKYNTIPADAEGLRRIYELKKSEDFEEGDGFAIAVGEMGMRKLVLKRAWEGWQRQVEIDPMQSLTLNSPQDDHFHQIADAQARLNILQAEIKEIGKRYKAAAKEKVVQADDRAARLRFRGIQKMQNHRIAECDGRPVIYDENGKNPCFKDDGQLIADYMVEVKKYRVSRNAARTARAKAERKAAADA